MEDKKNDIIGISSSVILHVLLLLAMFFLGKSCTEMEDMGMDGGVEVSLGEPDYGGPDNTPSMEQQAAQSQPETPTEPETESAQITSDDADAPEVRQETKPKPKPKPTETKPKPTETTPTTETKPVDQKPDKRSMFGGSKPSNSGGSGSGSTPGNEGRPDGSPDGQPDGSGTGSGGIGFSGDGYSGKIDGFKAVAAFKPVNEKQQFGTVVVKVCVDKDGKVVSVTGGQRGSTNTSAYLTQLSENAAKQFKFQRIGTATSLNCGEIRFIYKAG